MNFCHALIVVKRNYILYFHLMENRNLTSVKPVEMHETRSKETQIEKLITEKNEKTGQGITKKEMQLDGKIYRNVETRIHNIA